MYQYIIKSLKIGLWLLVPFLFISNSSMEPTIVPNNFEGKYNLETSGILELSLSGKAFFETYSNTSRFSSNPSLSLKFNNNSEEIAHSIEFIISKQDDSQELGVGHYDIANNIEGLLDGFEGVFGYANIKMTGEKPFFATKGKLVITKKSKNDVRGYVNVVLMGESVEKLFIKGDFHAIRHY